MGIRNKISSITKIFSLKLCNTVTSITTLFVMLDMYKYSDENSKIFNRNLILQLAFLVLLYDLGKFTSTLIWIKLKQFFSASLCVVFGLFLLFPIQLSIFFTTNFPVISMLRFFSGFFNNTTIIEKSLPEIYSFTDSTLSLIHNLAILLGYLLGCLISENQKIFYFKYGFSKYFYLMIFTSAIYLLTLGNYLVVFIKERIKSRKEKKILYERKGTISITVNVNSNRKTDCRLKEVDKEKHYDKVDSILSTNDSLNEEPNMEMNKKPRHHPRSSTNVNLQILDNQKTFDTNKKVKSLVKLSNPNLPNREVLSRRDSFSTESSIILENKNSFMMKISLLLGLLNSIEINIFYILIFVLFMPTNIFHGFEVSITSLALIFSISSFIFTIFNYIFRNKNTRENTQKIKLNFKKENFIMIGITILLSVLISLKIISNLFYLHVILMTLYVVRNLISSFCTLEVIQNHLTTLNYREKEKYFNFFQVYVSYGIRSIFGFFILLLANTYLLQLKNILFVNILFFIILIQNWIAYLLYTKYINKI